MIFGLWHPTVFECWTVGCCELLSSFYDLWSLTSKSFPAFVSKSLWIAFKFLWSLVFDIMADKTLVACRVVNCFQVFMIFGLWHQRGSAEQPVWGCELLSSFYDLWSLTSFAHCNNLPVSCELLSSFYDLWSLTSDRLWMLNGGVLWIAFKFLWSLVFDIRFVFLPSMRVLWIAFKFLWSLVFDILKLIYIKRIEVVNCFQVFMIFGLWHLRYHNMAQLIGCELLSSFYDLWSLTSASAQMAAKWKLWIAFKFLWSLVFDIAPWYSCNVSDVVNCFQVFMIFGLWHQTLSRSLYWCGCELLSSFYDLWSLTSHTITL